MPYDVLDFQLHFSLGVSVSAICNRHGGLGIKTTTADFLKPVFDDWLQPTRTCSRRESPAGGERDLWVEV